MDSSFIQKLRMNNIFDNNQPMGMPDFNAGNIDIDSVLSKVLGLRDQMHVQDRNWSQEQPNRVASIGSSIMNPAAEKPMNVRVGAGIDNTNPIDSFMNGGLTPYQSAQIGLGYKKADSTANIQQQNIEINRQKAAIADYKAKHPDHKVLTPKGGNILFYDPATNETIDSGISSGTMTDEDLQEIKGKQAIAQIDERGKKAGELQDKKSEAASSALDKRGEQRLGEIAASIAGKQKLQDSKPEAPLKPTQEKARVINEANKLVVERPDLAQFIVKDPTTGEVTISDKADGVTRQMITDRLYGNAGDIKIPAKVEDKKPVAGKVQDPLGIRK